MPGGRDNASAHMRWSPGAMHDVRASSKTMELSLKFMFNNLSMRGLQRLLRWLALLAVIAVPAALFYGGAQPYAVGLIPPPWDKFAHAGVFAILAAAVGYASGLRGARMWWLAFVFAVLVGVADEWHQISLPGRSAGWDDLAADAVGAALGATALWRWRQRVHRWLEEEVVSRH